MLQKKYIDIELQKIAENIKNETTDYKRIIFVLRYGFLPQEEELVKTILTKLLIFADLETKVEALQLLNTNTFSDKNFILKLLLMENDIAIPILKFSKNLSNELLFSLTKQTIDNEKLLLIAKRPEITEEIIEELMNRKSFNTDLQLILNKHVPDKYKKIILETSNNNKLIIEKILHLQNNNYINEIFNISPPSLRDFMLKNDPQHKIQALFENRKWYIQNDDGFIAIENEIDLLFKESKLHPIVLFTFLCKGEILGFIYGLAKLTDLSFEYLKRVLYLDYNENTLEQIYKNANLPSTSKNAIMHIYKIAISSISAQKLLKKNFANTIASKILSLKLNEKINEMDFYLNIINNK